MIMSLSPCHGQLNRVFMYRLLVSLVLILGFGGPAAAMHHGKHGSTYNQSGVMAHHARLTLGIGQRPAVLHADIHNKTDKNLRLIAAESVSFERIELHTHEKSDDGMMRMREVDSYILPPQASLKLKPGGDHLMLFGFKGKKGDEVKVTLRFNDGSKASVTVTAQARKKHGESGHHGH